LFGREKSAPHRKARVAERRQGGRVRRCG